VTADDAGERLWLRVERQTLTRLPVTGAVLFTILTFVLPLEALAAEPALAEGLAARLGELPATMAAYKGLTANRDAIRRYLEEAAAAGP
jgi:dimethylamine monooxygenase subunit A